MVRSDLPRVRHSPKPVPMFFFGLGCLCIDRGRSKSHSQNRNRQTEEHYSRQLYWEASIHDLKISAIMSQSSRLGQRDCLMAQGIVPRSLIAPVKIEPGIARQFSIGSSQKADKGRQDGKTSDEDEND